MARPRPEDIASGRRSPSGVVRGIVAVTLATFVLRAATGLTGALLIYLLADYPRYGGPTVGPLMVALLTALFYLAELVLSPPFGVLSDRRGQRLVMQLGPLFGLVAVLITALTAEIGLGALVLALPLAVGSLPLLGLTRVLEGASTAASVPSVLGFIAAATSGDEPLRGRAAARFELATIGGLALGFAAAGPLWALIGPVGFLLNALVYALAFGLYRWSLPAPEADAAARAPVPHSEGGWSRYRRLLSRSRVWLLAPTWVALNAGLGLYTSQTLFQLVRTPDERFAGQWLVGGLAPVSVTAAFLAGGGIFFLGLLFWGGRFAALRRTTMILVGIAGGAVLVSGALLLNHGGQDGGGLRLPWLALLGLGLFLLAAATPAALGLLADISESFPADRGAVMGLYSVFLGLGQIAGAFIGAIAAELWAFDGILAATLALLGVALVPLARLRRFELSVQPTPASGPDPEATLVDLSS